MGCRHIAKSLLDEKSVSLFSRRRSPQYGMEVLGEKDASEAVLSISRKVQKGR